MFPIFFRKYKLIRLHKQNDYHPMCILNARLFLNPYVTLLRKTESLKHILGYIVNVVVPVQPEIKVFTGSTACSVM